MVLFLVFYLPLIIGYFVMLSYERSPATSSRGRDTIRGFFRKTPWLLQPLCIMLIVRFTLIILDISYEIANRCYLVYPKGEDLDCGLERERLHQVHYVATGSGALIALVVIARVSTFAVQRLRQRAAGSRQDQVNDTLSDDTLVNRPLPQHQKQVIFRDRLRIMIVILICILVTRISIWPLTASAGTFDHLIDTNKKRFICGTIALCGVIVLQVGVGLWLCLIIQGVFLHAHQMPGALRRTPAFIAKTVKNTGLIVRDLILLVVLVCKETVVGTICRWWRALFRDSWSGRDIHLQAWNAGV